MALSALPICSTCYVPLTKLKYILLLYDIRNTNFRIYCEKSVFTAYDIAPTDCPHNTSLPTINTFDTMYN